MSICAGIRCKIFRKLFVFLYHYLNTFICGIIKRIILCKKKSHNSILKSRDDLHIFLTPPSGIKTMRPKYVLLEAVPLSFEIFYITKNKRNIQDVRFK